MAERTINNDKYRMISGMIGNISAAESPNLRLELSHKLMRVFRNDPEAVSIAFGKPEWLKLVVVGDMEHRSATIAHFIAATCPEESVELFNLVSRDRESYLPVIAARDTNGNTVGALVLGAMLRNEEERRQRKVFSDAAGQIIQFMLRVQSGEDVRGGVDIDMFVGPEGKSEAKERLVNALRDNPELETILKLEMYVGGAAFAHLMANDGYLGAELINMIRDKPFFLKIMQLRDSTGSYPVSVVFIRRCIGQLFEALETAPPETAKKILEEKIDGQDNGYVHLAHLMLADTNFYKRLDALLKSDKALESVYDLRAIDAPSGTSLTVRELISLIASLELRDVN